LRSIDAWTPNLNEGEEMEARVKQRAEEEKGNFDVK